MLQYGVFWYRALQGDFGYSFRYGVPATRLIVERLPNSLRLGAVAAVIGIVVGLPLGVIAAGVRRLIFPLDGELDGVDVLATFLAFLEVRAGAERFIINTQYVGAVARLGRDLVAQTVFLNGNNGGNRHAALLASSFAVIGVVGAEGCEEGNLGGHGRDSLVVTTSSILLVLLTCQYLGYILSVSFVWSYNPWRLTQGQAREPSKSQPIAAGADMSGSPRTCIRPKPPGSVPSARVPIGTGPTSSVGNSPLDTGALMRLIDCEARGST